jgi:hypothetical protein
MKFFFFIFLVVLLQISAQQYAIARYFEESTECKAGQEAIWGAVMTNKCTNQQQGNYSKTKLNSIFSYKMFRNRITIVEM